MREQQHVEEIGRVLDGHCTGRDGFVAASWRRCVEQHGMDPTRREPAYIVTDSELRDHRAQAEWMIGAARSSLQSLFRQVAGQNYVLLLTDAKGVCVDFFGDDLFVDDLRAAGLYLGSNWSEDLAGTCGVGSCIVTQEPVTVHQDDHFGNAHTLLSCTAAPIFDSLGQLAAVLDISLLRSPAPKRSQNLAMSLVTNAARRVEMANLMAESRRDWVLRFSASPEFLDVDPEAAVRLDGSGRVLGYTRAAGKLFGAGDVLGRRIDEVLDLSVDDLPDLMRDRPTEERVVPLRDGGALFGHAIAPQAPRSAPRPVRRDGPIEGLTGGDPAMSHVLGQAARLASVPVPLLICGETGTGKTKLAQAVHMASKAQGFHRLDCGGLRAEALDALAEAAPVPATLLLRRIEELPTPLAPRLTALLDGTPHLRPVTTSCVAPDQTGLPDTLLHRLAGATLTLPALRHRQDLPWLMDRLLRRKTTDDVRLSPSARAALLGRQWTGNLRELSQVLDVALVLSDGRVIDLTDLPAPLQTLTTSAETEESLEQILEACGWNMSRAARRLGVNRSTILRRIRRAGLQPPT